MRACLEGDPTEGGQKCPADILVRRRTHRLLSTTGIFNADRYPPGGDIFLRRIVAIATKLW